MKSQKLLRKISLAVLAVAMVVTAFLPFASNKAAALDSWGPQDRATFTWDSPATYPTFNSITNNPTIGDERNFVRVKEYGADGPHLDSADVVAGKEYEVYIYYHNNASASFNADGTGMADNVRVSTKLPEKLEAGQTGTIYGTISSTNATPNSVWDTAFLKANETVYMRYVPDSAVIHNSGTANGQILDANALFSEQGVKIAYNLANSQGVSLWGIIPGCNEYAGYITYRLVADQPKFGMEKEVSAESANSFADNISTIPGSILDFRITYKNTGTTEQKSVTVYDTMPEGVEYIPDSAYLVTTSNPVAQPLDDKLFNGGVVIGDFKPGEEATITYKAKVDANIEKFRCGDTTLYNDAKLATANGTINDKVRIIITRTCELPNTGPLEIVMAILVVGSICGGGYYLYRSRKTLNKVEATAKGDTIVEGDQKNANSQKSEKADGRETKLGPDAK